MLDRLASETRRGPDRHPARGCRLAADARTPALACSGLSPDFDARPSGGAGRGPAFPCLARRSQFHLPRHARIPPVEPRRRRRADAGRGIRPRHPRRPRLPVPARRSRLCRDDAAARRLPHPARAAHGHQGQPARPCASARSHGLCRGQALRAGRPAHRRIAHSRALHLAIAARAASGRAIHPPQDRFRHAQVGPRPEKPCRQGADGGARQLPARGTVPDFGSTIFSPLPPRSPPCRTGRGSRCCHASIRSTISFRFSFSCRATATPRQTAT